MRISRRFDIVTLFSALVAISVACDSDAPPAPPVPTAVIRASELSASPSAESDADARLAKLCAERLEVVDQVALWKWVHSKPIEDPAREAKVLDSVTKLAADHGLDPVEAKKFFESLMSIARQRQHALHEIWRKSGAPANSAEIAIEPLRQKIDRLTPELLEAWGRSVRK